LLLPLPRSVSYVAEGPIGNEPGPKPTLVVDLDWRTAAVAVASVLALFALFGVAQEARQTLTWIIIGSLLAMALNPLVVAVQARLHTRRGLAVGTVLVGLIAIVGAAVLLLGPPAIREARSVTADLPKVAENLDDIPIIGGVLRDNDVPAKLDQFLRDLPTRLGENEEPVVAAVETVLGGALAVFVTLLVTVVLLLDGRRVLRGVRRVVPFHHRAAFDRSTSIVYRTVGRYFAGSVLVALLAGCNVLIVGLLLGVALAPLAAVWTTLTNLIPQIGGFLGGSFFVLVAFAHSPTAAAICLAEFLVYQQLENHVIQPIIVGQAVELSPPVTMMAALIGASAAGVPGALVAVPLLGAAKAIGREIRPPVSGPPPAPRRRLKLPFRRRHDSG
jgi:predicted PurR-regulated permease PerM